MFTKFEIQPRKEDGFFGPSARYLLRALDQVAHHFPNHPALEALKPHLTGAVDDYAIAGGLLRELRASLAPFEAESASWLREVSQMPEEQLKGVLRTAGEQVAGACSR